MPLRNPASNCNQGPLGRGSPLLNNWLGEEGAGIPKLQRLSLRSATPLRKKMPSIGSGWLLKKEKTTHTCAGCAVTAIDNIAEASQGDEKGLPPPGQHSGCRLSQAHTILLISEKSAHTKQIEDLFDSTACARSQNTANPLGECQTPRRYPKQMETSSPPDRSRFIRHQPHSPL